jgi:hypothetical protein
MPRLELRVPLSPTPAFLNRLRILAGSIRSFYPDTTVRAYIGSSDFPADMGVTVGLLRADNIDVTWLSGAIFDSWSGTRSPYIETMNRRWSLPVDADFVMIADCDIIAVRPFPELFDVDAVQGVQAHVPPMNNIDWVRLFGLSGLPDIPRVNHIYSGAGIMCPPGTTGPFYANSGMIFAPRIMFEQMIAPYHDAIDFLRRTIKDTYWFDQVAVALAVGCADVPVKSLSLRYNFPNQGAFDQAHPEELADCRFLHYLRTDTVDRDKDFADLGAIGRFICRPGLMGSNLLLQKRVAELYEKVWPAPTYTAEDAPYA